MIAKRVEAEDGAQSELRPMITEPELLAAIRISRTTLYRLVRSGRFPPPVFVSPNKKRWFLDHVIEWQNAIDRIDPSPRERRRRVSPSPT